MTSEKTTNSEKWVSEQLNKIPRSGIRDFFELVQGRADVISLGVGEPDFSTPWHIREAAIYSLDKGHTSYTSNLGMPELRKEINRYVEETFQLSYNPESQILVTVGVSEALDLAMRAVLNPGDEVIYHEPCYVSYSPSVIMAHGKPIPVSCRAEDNFSVKPEAIEDAITSKSKVLLLNFPTNPTGGTMDRHQLEAIAEICCKHDLLVITDEIYSELTFEGEHTSIASIEGMKERCLFLHGFSKAYAMTGFRIGYAAGPSAIIDAMMKIHQYSMLCAGITAQEAAIEALKNGTPAVNQMREEYRMRRNYVIRSFNEMGLNCHTPRGSFYAFPSIKRTGLSSSDFAMQLLKEEDVACVPGTAFGNSGEGFIRCCFAASMDHLEKAMDKMSKFCESRIS